jgi:hypothetical protein
VYFLI